jgi:hypothetical protein
MTERRWSGAARVSDSAAGDPGKLSALAPPPKRGPGSASAAQRIDAKSAWTDSSSQLNMEELCGSDEGDRMGFGGLILTKGWSLPRHVIRTRPGP